MKNIAKIACCALVAVGTLAAQSPTKPAAKPAGLGKPEASSNEDLNIRAYIQLLRSDVKKQFSQIVGQVMRLDSEQSTKFWPIYKEFEAENARIGDQILTLLKDYADHYDEMTGAVADQLVDQLLKIEQQRTDQKRKYYERVKEALDPITAARFVQVVNQLENLVDLQIAAQLPVIGVE